MGAVEGLRLLRAIEIESKVGDRRSRLLLRGG
jgi:hypothetical protein